MGNKLIYFTLVLGILSSLFSGCIGKNKIESKSTQRILPKVFEEKEEFPKLLSEKPRIGSIKELGIDESCKKFGGIIIYVQTSNYKVYVCGDVERNKPRSMIVVNIIKKSTGRERTVIKDNPSILWNKSYLFGSREIGVVINWASVSNTPEFYTFATFAEEYFISEKINTYLYNETIFPKFRKATLLPDKQANERFLKFLPAFYRQTPTCKISKTSTGKIPDSSIALEISTNKYLVESICYPTGYNRDFQYFLYSEEDSKQKIKLIPFDTLNPSLINVKKSEIIELQTVSGYPQFFPEDNTLRVFHKGVGAGGCGSAAEYKLVGERFELQEFREYECRGNNPDWTPKSPEEFPKIYP